MVRHLIDDVQLLYRQLIYLVQDVDARDVSSVALNDINELVNASVTSHEHVSTHDLVLSADREDDLGSEHGLRHHRLEVNWAFILASNNRIE